jgi:hypothetical protein
VRRVEPPQVADHRHQEAPDERGQPGQQPPPRPDQDQHVQHGRHDHDQVLVPERRGYAQEQPGPGRGQPPRPFLFPDQEGERRHDHERGPDVAEHVLLEDQLQRVEQDGDAGQGGQPRPRPEPEENGVHQTGRGQPGQMLGQRDQPQGVRQRLADDQDGVSALPHHVRAPRSAREVVRVVQVPHAVREDQRRAVGEQHHAPQPGREHDQQREQPVAPEPLAHSFGSS